MNRIKCFLIEKTGREFWRRTSRTDFETKVTCPVHGDHHRADTPWAEGHLHEAPRGDGPEACPCGYTFTAEERRYCGSGCSEYRRTDTGEILSLDDPHPAGAMWYGDWMLYDGMPDYGQETQDSPMHWWKGPDNRILQVMTPGGPWTIDSRASNCTMPEDNKHRCWVRHGVPPEITVDKNGLTCHAGAGSIQCGSYHGFLRNGYLEEC